MPHNENLNPAQRELEAALARLTPAASGLDHDDLLYRAGQASVRRRCRAWQFSTAGITLLFVGLLIWQPRTTPGERIVYVPVQPAPAAKLAQSESSTPARPIEARAVEASYLQLREQVLRRGVDALPAPAVLATTDEPLRARFSERVYRPREQRRSTLWSLMVPPTANGDGS